MQQAATRREIEEVKASERRTKSEMEHEALLRLEALEIAAQAEKAEKEASEARASAELEAGSLRHQVRLQYTGAVP